MAIKQVIAKTRDSPVSLRSLGTVPVFASAYPAIWVNDARLMSIRSVGIMGRRQKGA